MCLGRVKRTIVGSENEIENSNIEKGCLLMNSVLVSRRTVSAAFGLVLAAVLCAAAQQGAPPDLTGKTAEEAYKNIQVLKGVPAEQVVPAMRVMAGSLGVGCTFCHVQGQFDKDDKDTKKTARRMITMMMDINKNNFKGQQQVTCFTCHNHSNNPASTLTFAEPSAAMQAAPAGAPAEGAAAPQGPLADQILASYVQALGGEQAIRKVTSRTITSVREVPAGGGGGAPRQAQVEEYYKAPNMMASFVHAANGATTATGFDGTTGWTQDAKGGVKDLTGTEEARAARTADLYEAVDLKQEYPRLTARGTAKVGDHDTYVLVGTPQGDERERLFFDTKSGLLVRKITVMPTPAGNSPTQTDYDDYRDTGSGVKVPFLIRVSTPPDNTVTTRVQKVQDNTPIDSSKLAKPAPKAAQ